MTEYAPCPGVRFDRTPCGSVVKIFPGDQVNICCRKCWQTSWEPIQAGLMGDYDFVAVDHGHTDQCGDRQAARTSVDVVTDRQFVVMGKVPDGKDVPKVR